MANTPQRIAKLLTTGTDTLYTFPSSGPTRGVLEFLNLCSLVTGDVTVDIWQLDIDGTTKHYLLKGVTVPGGGVISFTGLVTLDDGSSNQQKIQATCSAGSSVDALGTVIENA
jgi:hypothetical protein